MNTLLDEMAVQIELHSVEGIKNCFSRGIHPDDLYHGKPLLEELTSEYTRSPFFSACIRVFIECGLTIQDALLLSVLADQPGQLEVLLANQPGSVHARYSMRCAYTPLNQATLLHICAEFNLVAAAEVLLRYGATVNAAAGVDEHGFGGQTPIFHTVNQNGNQSADMMALLLAHGADCRITVPGLIWGKGYPWETFIPSVNPVSYAMMGLLPQFHRDEQTIAQVVSVLLQHAYGINYMPENVPNKYLLGG